jgi:hypothetical protein
MNAIVKINDMEITKENYMKTMKTQIKEAAYIVLGLGLLAIVVSALQGCGTGEWYSGSAGPAGPAGAVGATGAMGSQGNGAGVVTTNEPTACGGNGGVQVVSFLDPTNTGIYEPGDTITSSSLVCNGEQGVAGQNGSNGINGSSSTVTMTAATVTECANGGYELTLTNGSSSNSYAVCNGQVGATGNQGIQGLTGAAGSAGAPGTVVSVVQFCPGTTSYPGTFAEVGVCIGGNIWAVYSANDGFLTEVVPGEYSSDGVNDSCNFTVAANCVVTQN